VEPEDGSIRPEFQPTGDQVLALGQVDRSMTRNCPLERFRVIGHTVALCPQVFDVNPIRHGGHGHIVGVWDGGQGTLRLNVIPPIEAPVHVLIVHVDAQAHVHGDAVAFCFRLDVGHADVPVVLMAEGLEETRHVLAVHIVGVQPVLGIAHHVHADAGLC